MKHESSTTAVALHQCRPAKSAVIDRRYSRAVQFVVTACICALMTFCAWAGWKPGDKLPNLTDMGLEGALPALQGKVVLIDFWASWCGPCRHSFPVMAELQKTYGSRGLVVLTINVDDERSAMEDFLKKTPAAFAVVRDAKHKVVAEADVPTMPASFLVDRAGVIRFIHKGFDPGKARPQYIREIEELLK